ncbi:MAG: SDR family oxidoreductase [Thermodesulfobacteriota bacterium]
MDRTIEIDELNKRVRILLGRFVAPEEVVPAFIFFALEESSYITKQLLSVDGG